MTKGKKGRENHGAVMAMTNPRLEVVEVTTLAEAREEIFGIRCDPRSVEIMAPKAVLKVVRCCNILLQDAVIIKQDMLSVGGEVAIPKNAYEAPEESADILIFGTVAHLTRLVGKLDRHYPRIRAVAKELSAILAVVE